MFLIIFSLVFCKKKEYINFDTQPKIIRLSGNGFFLIDSRYGASVVGLKKYPDNLNEPDIVELKSLGKDHYEIQFIKNGKFLCNKKHDERLALCHNETDKFTDFVIQEFKDGKYMIIGKESKCIRTSSRLKGTKLPSYHLETSSCSKRYNNKWHIKNFEDVAPKKIEPKKVSKPDKIDTSHKEKDEISTRKDSTRSSESDSSIESTIKDDTSKDVIKKNTIKLSIHDSPINNKEKKKHTIELIESQSSSDEVGKSVIATTISTDKDPYKRILAGNEIFKTPQHHKMIPVKKSHYKIIDDPKKTTFTSDSSSSDEQKNVIMTKDGLTVADKHSLKGHHNFSHKHFSPTGIDGKIPRKVPIVAHKKPTNTIMIETAPTEKPDNAKEKKKVSEKPVAHSTGSIQSIIDTAANNIMDSIQTRFFGRDNQKNPPNGSPSSDTQTTLDLPDGGKLSSNDGRVINIPPVSVLSNNGRTLVHTPSEGNMINDSNSIKKPTQKVILDSDQSVKIPPEDGTSHSEHPMEPPTADSTPKNNATIEIPINKNPYNDGQSIETPVASFHSNEGELIEIPANKIPFNGCSPIETTSASISSDSSQSTNISPRNVLFKYNQTINDILGNNLSNNTSSQAGDLTHDDKRRPRSEFNDDNNQTTDSTLQSVSKSILKAFSFNISKKKSNFVQLDPDCERSKNSPCQYASCLDSLQVQSLLMRHYRRTLCMHSSGMFKGTTEPCYCPLVMDKNS